MVLAYNPLEHVIWSKRRLGNYGGGGRPSLAEDNTLKRERIRQIVFRIRTEARQDVFDYIEMIYNLTLKHARNGMLSPIEFERQHEPQSEGF